MMSAGPPYQPLYSRTSVTATSTMAESPRPLPVAPYPHHHQIPTLPYDGGGIPSASITTPRFSSQLLSPLSIPTTNTEPLVPSRQPPIVNAQIHQSHNPHQPSPQHSESRRPTYPSRVQNSPSFSSPITSTFSPSASPFSTDRGCDESDRRSSATTLLPSPVAKDGGGLPDEKHPDNTRLYSRLSASENSSSLVPRSPKRSVNRYQIKVRQQPVAARACGFGERDRRVIDPPPIVQLIANEEAVGPIDPSELRYPFNVVHCTLWSVDGNNDETALLGQDKRLTRRLMGTLVSSPFVGLDEAGQEGSFFCFPDLSCRTPGRHRLRFVLMRLEPSNLPPNNYTPIITEALSDVFTVYTAKEFPGMRPSTALTKALKRQGCAISVKKGNDKAIGQASGSGKEGSGDEDSPYSGSSQPKRRRKT